FAEPRMTIERYEQDQQRVLAGEARQHPEISEGDYRKAKASKFASDARGVAQDVYEALNHVWSVAAVLRPAQTLRTLADDGMRSLTMIGMLPTLLAGTRGAGRIIYNTTRRGMTRGQERQLAQAARALDGRTFHEVQVGEIGA